MPRASVLIPAFDAAATLRDAVESICRQTEADLECIVVDDGSTDETWKVLLGCAERDPRVRPFRRDRGGIVAALNFAAAQARAPILVRLDADDVAEPERVAVQVAFLDAHPDVVVVGSRMTAFSARCPGGRTVGGAYEEGLPLEQLREGNLLSHPSVAIRQSAFEQVGGYREGTAPAEDLDLWLRLATCGRLVALATPLVRYRVHPAQSTAARLGRQATAILCALENARRRAAGAPELPPATIQTLDDLREAGIADERIAATLGTVGAGRWQMLATVDEASLYDLLAIARSIASGPLPRRSLGELAWRCAEVELDRGHLFTRRALQLIATTLWPGYLRRAPAALWRRLR